MWFKCRECLELSNGRDIIEAMFSLVELTAVPGRVFEIVENVIKTAKEGKTTLFKASELLEITSEEFLYARNASLDDFDLRRRSQEQVSDYSRVFERMIRHRIEALMNEAAADMEECQVTLGE